MVRHMRVCVFVCLGATVSAMQLHTCSTHLALINQLINLVEYMQQACCMYEA
jgi:hypothetical protein